MSYHMPTTMTFGEGVLQELPAKIRPFGERTALFAGGSSFDPFRDIVLDLLRDKDVTVIEGVRAEPEIRELERLTDCFRERSFDNVVAFGGGSVMDLAKAVAFCSQQDASPRDILENGVPDRAADSVPVVAIPTTAGTGSEVTPFVVLWDHEAKKKNAVGHEKLYCKEAIVDPELTYSMPPHVTATTGMDAFTQACEAYWNTNHNPTSDTFALEAISLILPALPQVVANGDDKKARHDMMLGSMRAGQAFSNTRTAACHSISYPMTLYWGVTHGQAVGITLPEVLLLNDKVMPDRSGVFCAALDVSDMESAAGVIRKMMRLSGLKTSLSELGVDNAGVNTIVEKGFAPERMANNPYQFSPDSLHEMLLRIL